MHTRKYWHFNLLQQKEKGNGKILVIDGFKSYLYWNFEETQFILVHTTDEERGKFNLYKTDISTIFISENAPGTLSSFDLVKEMRKSFDGDIVITVSRNPYLNKILVEAWSKYAVPKERLMKRIYHLMFKKPRD